MPKHYIKLSVDNAGNPEIFVSIQGEGPKIGRPSVFVRLSECNLYCKWCDTAYTWNWQGTNFQHIDATKYLPWEQQVLLSSAEIMEKIEHTRCKNVVFTGGEPLVQQKLLEQLFEQLSVRDFAIDFETNGTIKPTYIIDQLVSTFVVSPKLANSGVGRDHRIRNAVISFFAGRENAYFKFVISEPADLLEVDQFVAEYTINSNRVYLMPCATSLAELNEKQTFIANECVLRGYNFSDRLHVRLYGNKRGT